MDYIYAFKILQFLFINYLVIVTGRNRSLGYATLKYDQNGNLLWEAKWGTNWANAEALAVDSKGFVYVTGFDALGTSSDYATIKYDPNGNQLWVAKFNGPANDWDFARDIELDQFGNVYVTGYCDGQGTNSKYATVKYDPTGNELWAEIYSEPTNAGSRAHAIAVDSSGNAYVTGYEQSWTWEDGYIRNYATIKYDPNGNNVWVVKYDGPPGGFSEAHSIAVDDANNVYVVGEREGSNTYSDYETIKYSQVFCTSKPAMDFNGDCKVDFQDFALFSRGWLDCNLDPPSACWE